MWTYESSGCTFWTCLHKGRAAVSPWGQASPWESAGGLGVRRCPPGSGSAEGRGWRSCSRCKADQADQTGDLHASERWKPWWFDLGRKHNGCYNGNVEETGDNLSKLIMGNRSWKKISQHQSWESPLAQWLHPQCKKKSDHKSFLPAPARLLNSSIF